MFGNVRPRHKSVGIDSNLSRKRKLKALGSARGSRARFGAPAETLFAAAIAESQSKLSKSSQWQGRHRQHAGRVPSPEVRLTGRVYASKLSDEHEKLDLVSDHRSCDVHMHGGTRISNTARSR